MREHWKTSLVGAGLILTGIALFHFGPPEHAPESGAIILAGVGFILTPDAKRELPPPQEPPKS